MKTLLFLSWLALGGVGYFGYGFYNDTIAKRAASDQALQDLTDKNKALVTENDSLRIQLNTEKSNEASLRQGSAAAAPPVAPAPEAGVTPGSFVFPTTITTISGTTYQNCKFDQATPDGISFFHANGVAKVPYTDLDPVFAKVFGYDPAAAAQYAKEEAIKEGQSDARRNAVETQQAVPALPTPVSTTPIIVSGAAMKSPSPDTAAIRARIATLQQDLAEKTAIMDREYRSTTTHTGYNGNAYVDEIKSDQTQIAALQVQLAGH